MSFWNLQEPVTGEMEMGGGDIEPIPSGTSVLAAIDEAKWDEYQGDSYISLRWQILAPDEYKNRKIFHKVRVLDNDSKKSEKAKRMLAAIDANAGGQLVASGQEPTDQSMTAALVNKPMVLKLQVWEMETADGKKRGNWVSAVSPRKGNAPVAASPKPAPAPAPSDVFDDDIPF